MRFFRRTNREERGIVVIAKYADVQSVVAVKVSFSSGEYMYKFFHEESKDGRE